MRCPVCENKKDFVQLSPELCQADNFLCRRCGLVFIPRKTASMRQYYKDDGYFKKSPNIAYRKSFVSKSLLIEIAKSRVKDALEILAVNCRKKRILDVGCGYGEILYSLKKDYSSKVVGVEPSPESAKYGNELFSVPIRPVLIEEFKQKEKFDIIWCSHVLEHVSDPTVFLKKIKQLLAKDGYIFIEVPNILKPSGGFDLNTFLYSEHLQTFSAYNLWLLLNKHNLHVTAFSDKHFLKFWCQISNDKKKVEPKPISPEQVLAFLKKYKQRYTIIDFSKVYGQKLLYGVKLVAYKLYDFF